MVSRLVNLGEVTTDLYQLELLFFRDYTILHFLLVLQLIALEYCSDTCHLGLVHKVRGHSLRHMVVQVPHMVLPHYGPVLQSVWSGFQ